MSVSSSSTRRRLLPEGIEPVRVIPGPADITILRAVRRFALMI